jgi:FkbM family methyltransferase
MNIIQVGCYKGDDHVTGFIKQNYDAIKKAILIDANEKFIEQCKVVYKDLPKVEICHYAIVTDDSETINFYISAEAPEECTAFKSYVESSPFCYTTVETPAINLNNLFKKYNITDIDRLYIDAEGMDVDIVNSIDFNNVRIKYLHFEQLHTEGTRLSGNGVKLHNCLQMLSDLGYQIQSAGWDIIAIKTV